MLGKSKYQILDELRPEELAALEADIAKRGVQVPVEVDDEGNILDGHNRVEIANRLGKPYGTIVRRFKTEQEKREHIIKLNLARRHLDPLRWGLTFKMLLEVRRVERKRGRRWDSNSATVAELAQETGVPKRTAERRLSLADAYEKLPEDKKEAVHRGKMTVAQAKRDLRKEANRQREAEAKASVPQDKPWVITADQSIIQCSAIITDPPYGILDDQPWEPEEIEAFTREWALQWSQCGADSIVIFWSQRYLWDGRRWFDETLTGYTFRQLLIWHYPNNKSPQDRSGFKQTWEPILFYRLIGSARLIKPDGSEWGDGINDFDCHVAAVPQSNFDGADMKQHPAQKPVSVMRWLISALTEPGELVCDPFAGSGTTGVAAAQLKRRFHGIEVSQEYRRIAEGRIAAYGNA